MKKLMISMLAMAAMVSCTNEIENPDQPKVNENEPVAITFGSSIVGIQTKAVTESSTQFENDDKIKVYGYKGESSITGYLNSEFIILPQILQPQTRAQSGKEAQLIIFSQFILAL